MNIEELNSIISKGENSRIEFKESGEMVPLGFYQSVVSFLNHEGGVILLGVDDDGLVTGIDLKEKGSSLAEKGVKLLPKRTLTILKVLMICLLPAKVEEMKQILSFGSLDKLRELYLNPLRKDGLIEITVKDKLNSPEQKYRLTEKGRLFLGEFEII